MTFIFDVAMHHRFANQSRAVSLLTWALSLALVGVAVSPVGRGKPAAKASLLFAAASLTFASSKAAETLAEHDRIIQDYNDTSDNQRQQFLFEMLRPSNLMKSAAPAATPGNAQAIAPAAPPPTHNISRAIAGKLRSTVILGAPRAGKGYALAKALELFPANVDLWLIDPKDDPNESYYWRRVPISQRVRFDVTTLDPDAVDSKVTGLFERFLLAPSSSDAPKVLIVDECAPGLAKGMTPKAYKAFMGRLSTICSVGPSKGKFVAIMAQASTVDDLAMSNGNKASFRLCAVGHAENTEKSWFRSLQRSMGFDLPSDELTGYIQMLDGTWGYSERFELDTSGEVPEEDKKRPIAYSQSQLELLSYFHSREREHVSLRQLTQSNLAKRENLRSNRAMVAALSPLVDAGDLNETEDGDYVFIQSAGGI